MSEQKLDSMRKALGVAIQELGAKNIDIVVVGADTTESVHLDLFGKDFPDRFFNVGIAEQNMVGIAAGLAFGGKTVFCGTYMVFMERAIDQIRNTIGYCGLDVKLIGAHTGLSVGPDGGSHQTIEDIAIMRAIPKFRVVAPCDAPSAKAIAKQAAETRGPFYIRIVRPDSMNVYADPADDFKVGKANVLREGKDVSIIACGIMVQEALKAADKLATSGVSASVIDCHTIKPIDEDAIVRAASSTGRIVTAEDHNVIGGLGSAVAEVLSRKRPTPMSIVGVRDTFGESGGQPELMAKYGISSDSIFEEAKRLVKT